MGSEGHGPPSDKPDSGYDFAMLLFAIALTIPLIVANGVIIIHRKRNYFRALGGVGFIVATSVAGIVWIAVNFVTNLHFTRRGILNQCSLWTFWLQLPLGCCLWMSLIYLRLYRLYLLSTKPDCTSIRKPWWFYLLLLLLPAIIFSTIGTICKASSRNLEPNQNCQLTGTWKYVTYITLPPLYISLIVQLLFRLRKQTDFLLMSERRHTSESSMMAFMFYLLDAIVFVSDKQSNIAGRCFLTFCVCWLVFMDFWVRLWKPVYLCLFKAESEMKKFEDELRWCGAGFFDKVNVATVLRYTTRSISIPSNQLHDGDWVLRTMDLLFSETAEREEQIQKLDHKNSCSSIM
ncbi:hypothetical protein SUGI_1040250 [Cryptomeria japonica]|nr:hypothetical protein SUGI_1040250 [Cryptomeria japonica]